MALLLLACATSARAQTPECVKCHDALLQKKVVHAAAQIGCETCHRSLDAGSVPHRSRGRARKGLDEEPPELCHQCHEAKAVGGKFAHAPVLGGLCATCHDPHASPHRALVRKPIVALCLDCHAQVRDRPHVISGFARSGHPLGDERGGQGIDDPSRPGAAFGCTSCHDPHQASFRRLNRFDSDSMTGLCEKCHRM